MELLGLDPVITTIIVFVVGLVAGGIIGYVIAISSTGRQAEEAAPSSRETVSERWQHTRPAITNEVFTAYISKVDVERGMVVPIARHLADVVEESRETGTFGHQMRLVIIGYDDGTEPAKDESFLRHVTRIHEQCPHLPMWLDDESMHRYLKLLHLGLQLESGKDASWGDIDNDIARRAAAAIRADIGEDPKDVAHRLMIEGLDRVRRAIDDLDPAKQALAEQQEAEQAAGKRKSRFSVKKPKEA